MVIMKGTTRQLQKVIVEDSSSTASSRIISIYGITSYTQLQNVVIEILNTFSASEGTSATLNVNSLRN